MGVGVAQGHSQKLAHALVRGLKLPALINIRLERGCAMDAASITQLVSNLGFPIVCVGVLFWMQYKQQEAHADEAKRWTDVLAENTEALRDLKEVVALLKDKVANEK